MLLRCGYIIRQTMMLHQFEGEPMLTTQKNRPARQFALLMAVALLVSGCTNPVTGDSTGGDGSVPSVDDYSTLYVDAGAGLAGVEESSSSFADVDGDGDEDVLITGLSGWEEVDGDMTPVEEATLYLNEGNGSFAAAGAGLAGVIDGASAFADVDGDGDEDLVISGESSSGDSTTLYLNDGNGSFSEDSGQSFAGVASGDVTFADIEPDGDPDLLITGSYDTDLYLNDGSGNFSEVTNPVDNSTPLPAVTQSAAAFADVDGDDDQDVFVAGYSSTSSAPVGKLFINDGAGVFSESPSGFAGVKLGSVSFADVDGDDDQDLIITGRDASGNNLVTLYENDGSGDFAKDTAQSSDGSSPVFTGVYFSSSSFADVDADGDQDLLVTGRDASNYLATLYVNDGNGNFSDCCAGLTGVYTGSSDFADLEGDGDQDLVITGSEPGESATIYVNTMM